MEQKAFTLKEVFTYGYKKTREHLFFLGGIFLFLIIISFILGQAQKSAEAIAPLGSIILKLVALIVQMVTGMGLIHIGLALYKGGKVAFMDLFSETHRFLDYFVGYILFILIVLGGMLLLIIPGIIWGTTYMFYGYAIIDKKMKPREALRESARLTKNHRLELFGFLCVALLINILGAALVGVGLLFTLPLTYMAVVYIYKKLDEKATVSEIVKPVVHEAEVVV